MKVSWMSAGVSSAVATKLAIDNMGLDKVMYIHIDDQHPDSIRFVKDCEKWFNMPIETIQSPWKSVEKVLTNDFYVGIDGAKCTKVLKRTERIKWEYELPYGTNLVYIWGLDYDERDRAERLDKSMPQAQHICPLIDKKMTKVQAHEILKASGIKRPAMYELGYHNNNCIGCVKGGMGYWNKIRVDFPEVFKSRAKLERTAGRSYINGVTLDDLAPDRGRHAGPIVDDCGIMCELIAL